MVPKELSEKTLNQFLNNLTSTLGDPTTTLGKAKTRIMESIIITRELTKYFLLKRDKEALTRGVVNLMLEIKRHNDAQNVFLEETKKLRLVVDNTLKGGKEPPKGPNWLKDLELGSVFRVLEKNTRNFLLIQFALLQKSDDNKTSKLFTFIPTDIPEIDVDNIRFCERFEYVDTIGIFSNPKEEELGKE
jgi:hypothetical protein